MMILDCTLRDGGYYNDWDFSPELIRDYLAAMKAAQVNVVELGFRSLKNQGFTGPCAYTTDQFLQNLVIPEGLLVAVMVNGAELCTELGCEPALQRLFPMPAADSPVDIVRFACHFHELPQVLPAAGWLVDRGYRVGLNLMQIADRTRAEVAEFTRLAGEWPVEVVYFADSMGGMTPDDISRLVGWLREGWDGPLGIHTHDNMGLALSNTLRAHADGVTWLDATVTGMGRGPGNARTEELVIEVDALSESKANLVPLMTLIRKHFGPMKAQYGWGTNPYYYLAGKYGLHPTYIQKMQCDARYDEEDVLAVIDHLRTEGGKSFSFDTLDYARQFYREDAHGNWNPAELMAGREVLILGTGPGVAAHRPALESFIRRTRPLVIALNTQSAVASDLIDLRIACHPLRLLADAEDHAKLPQPLITPASMLSDDLVAAFGDKRIMDFGLGVKPGCFEFHATHCIAPAPLVLAYALAAATSGRATRILMAGFDGYPDGDPRNEETSEILETYRRHTDEDRLIAITPTRHRLRGTSIYAPTV
ncbi:aldolase catalytic domain-containing protein [Roseovarius sp. D22-M7]|uniref:aldolase catalytic domain-containing protein n=1 Tax=Roseovarius sp. D22-M7 TaxID=3127116 RepID=UPI00300F9BB8